MTNDAPTEKQVDKLATLEMQLAAVSNVDAPVNVGQNGQYETSTYGNVEKQPPETDESIKVPTDIATPNANGAQVAQPKVSIPNFIYTSG